MGPSQTSCTGSYTLSRKNPQNCMGRLRYIKTTHPLGLLYPVVAALRTMQPNTWLVYSPPLWVKNCHSIKNTKELVDKLRDLEIPPARKLVSYIHVKFWKCQCGRFIRKSEGLGENGILYVNRRVLENWAIIRKLGF